MNTDLVRMFLCLLSSKYFLSISRYNGQITITTNDSSKPVVFGMSLSNSKNFFISTDRCKDYKIEYRSDP